MKGRRLLEPDATTRTGRLVFAGMAAELRQRPLRAAVRETELAGEPRPAEKKYLHSEMTHPTPPTELEALRARMRQLHADAQLWFASPEKPAEPLLMTALALSMDLVATLIKADAENRALRAELAERPPHVDRPLQ